MIRSKFAAVLLASGSLWLLPGALFAQVTSSVTRTVSFDYDAYGNLSRQTVEPDDVTGQYKAVTDYAPDAYGSILTRTLSWTDPTLGAQSRVVETNVYDSRSRFATNITNAKGQAEARGYSDAYGNLTSLIGPNALTTTWQYDGWGRKTRENRADGTATTWAYRKCVDTCTGGAATVKITQNWSGASQTNVPSEDFSDVLGRSIRNRTWGFDGTAILTERIYDSSGRLYQTSRPRFAIATPIWSTRSYDPIGRVIQQQSPNAGGTGSDTTTMAYHGLSLTRTDANSHLRTETRNGLNLLKSVTDAANKTTSYVYDPFGNLTRTIDPLLNRISVTYDRLGRKTQLADPNLGTWNYLVDALGQTWQQTDAKSQVTTFTFDALGRMTRRLEPGLDSRWDYDTATKGIGKLAEAYSWVGGAKDYRRIYGYDSLSRVSATTVSLDWDYVAENTYDGYGRLRQRNSRRNVKGGSGGPATAIFTVWNPQGYAYQTWRSNDGTNTLMRQVLLMDAESRVTRENAGASSAWQTNRVFNTYTGRLQGQTAGSSNSASLQNDAYGYDAVGNLTSRSQLVATSGSLMSESFGYDLLDRLATSVVAGQASATYNYDALGDVTSKANVGSYLYPPSGGGSTRPNAVASISGTVAGIVNPVFSYDANGNTLSGLGRGYVWTSFNQPASIDKLSGGSAVQRTAFLYDTEHQRTRQTISPMSGGVPGSPTTTIYYGGSIQKEIDTVANTTTIRTYLPGAYVEEKITGTTVAATASAARNSRFFLQDHLGSALGVVDDAGTVLQRMGYDPWGRRRNTNGTDDAWSSLGTLANNQDHTGFTDEEQLDKLGLVNLNGRIYDPIAGRMMSADPFVPQFDDPQALNRYSYVLNSPLVLVDPSGFDFSDYQPRTNVFPDRATLEKVIISGTRPQELDRVEITGNRPACDAQCRVTEAVQGIFGLGPYRPIAVASFSRSASVWTARAALAVAVAACNIKCVAIAVVAVGAAIVIYTVPDPDAKADSDKNKEKNADQARSALGTSTASAGAPPPPGDDDPKKGGIKNSTDKQLKDDGINAEKFKEDVVGKRRGGEFNIAVDKTTGEVYLTPVRRGAGEPIPTGYRYSELSNLFPRSGP